MECCSPNQWYQTTDTFLWNSHQIVYKEENVGQDYLLLVHGFPTASYDWWKLWQPLSRHFSLIAPDMLGFGYSDKPQNFPYSIMTQADLILDLLKSKGIHRFHIIAHDYGDTVVQEILARTQEDATFEAPSVCLLNGGIFPESHHPLPIQKLLMSPVGFVLSRLLNKQKFVKSFSKIFGAHSQLKDKELDDYWMLVSRKNGHRIAHKIIRYMKERVEHRERWVGALRTFQNPLALINGPEDPISGQVMVDRYKEIISDKNIWLLEGIGHYPQVEAPQQLLNYYLKFVEKQ
ncbi:MAG: alpha/beta hydrolase [Reichenbachiella sp.]|uniref:alpha/beta fold hydrolase n=1 Tax=Reichenbachiella sp. TaxID=2184521 RepID=UPI00326421D6